MDNKKIIEERDRILTVLRGKTGRFYLAGGTALSLYYFHHRESYDIDLFTKEFSKTLVEEIVSHISNSIEKKGVLDREQEQKDKVQVMVYLFRIDEENVIKIDFVEDAYRLIKPPKSVDGIPVLSIEDIYIRKIYAACGSASREDDVGRKMFIGGRQTARDFFDLYYLSKTFMPLSKFAFQYCNEPQLESIVVWYRRYDRMSMMDDLLEITTDKIVDYREMERHFKKEIESIIRGETE